MKQGCDGGRPQCGRCVKGGHNCFYVLTPWQRERAEKEEAKYARRTPGLVEQPRPVEAAPTVNRDSMLPGRPILPFPEVPRPDSTILDAGRDEFSQSPQDSVRVFAETDALLKRFRHHSQ